MALDSFKNYHDHFKKTKYSENFLVKVIDYLVSLCAKILKFDAKVRFTATSFFRRFYFRNSLLEFDPYHIAVVCVFLAAKVEEKDVTLPWILEKIKTEEKCKGLNVQTVNDLEIRVVQSLEFQFKIHNTLEPIRHIKQIVEHKIFSGPPQN